MNDSLSPRRLRALIAMAWLAAGALLLLLTPLTGHSETLGWTPAFWLLLAPASVLVAMKPGLPMALVGGLFRIAKSGRAQVRSYKAAAGL